MGALYVHRHKTYRSIRPWLHQTQHSLCIAPPHRRNRTRPRFPWSQRREPICEKKIEKCICMVMRERIESGRRRTWTRTQERHIVPYMERCPCSPSCKIHIDVASSFNVNHDLHRSALSTSWPAAMSSQTCQCSAKSRRRYNPFGLWLRFHHGFSSCITYVSTFFGSFRSFLFSVPLSMPHLQHHSLLHQVGWRIPSGWYQACQCLVEPTRQCPWLRMVHDIIVKTYSLPLLLIINEVISPLVDRPTQLFYIWIFICWVGGEEPCGHEELSLSGSSIS